MSYRDKPPSVREIGKALGVSAVLEGSVRKEKNRVRVNVQLIDAANDDHIWAEEYDRDLTDVFAIQSDLAQKIAQQLQAKLSPNEKAQLTRKPTENAEAYLAFVQAHNLFVPEDNAKLEQAEQLFERALQLDPNFALAAAGLSQLQSWIYHTTDPTPPRRSVRARWPNAPCSCSPICPKAILRSAFPTTMGTAISKQRRRNSRSRRKVCLTSQKFIWPWAQFSGGRVAGPNQPRTCRRQPN